VFHTVTADDLERRRSKHAQLIEVAAPHIQWVSATLSSFPHAIYLTDQEGVVLASAGDEQIRTQFGLLPGFQWCEDLMGTNGAGTALVEGKPVAVFGAEHYVEAFQGATCTASPIHDPSGAVIGAIDITSAACDATPDRLTLVSHVTFVIERELQLLHSEQKALVENEQKDQFLAVLAHELRGPLSALSNSARVVQMIGAGNDALAQTAKQMARQTHLLDVLVSELLDVARVTKGIVELKRDIIDVRQCVSDALDTVQDMVRERRQHVQWKVTEEPLVIDADPVRVTEIVANLLTNASRYSPPESIIEIDVINSDGQIEITVKDSGIGIEESRLPIIFDAFVSARNDEGNKNLGLGLWLTRRFAELHGGSVMARSAGVGKGAAFTVMLPVRSPTA
jgi:signal transduction histidine kinase